MQRSQARSNIKMEKEFLSSQSPEQNIIGEGKVHSEFSPRKRRQHVLCNSEEVEQGMFRMYLMESAVHCLQFEMSHLETENHREYQ